MSVVDLADYPWGRVAVLAGGDSAEREVSLRSGRAVLAALRRRKIDCAMLDRRDEFLPSLRAGGFDRAFIALHGGIGESGALQGALELIGLPYTGSAVAGSAVCMDKALCKTVWSGAGLPTPAWARITEQTDWRELVARLGLPLAVKPAREGSSLGMSLVREIDELPEACRRASGYDPSVIAECWIEGDELTLAMVAERQLPEVRIEPARAYYDYAAKYEDTGTRYHCPSGLDQEARAELAELAGAAFAAAQVSGWGRLDLMRDRSGRFFCIEINTVPGLTQTSLVPKAAAAVGWDFDELVLRILASSRRPVSMTSARGRCQ